MIENKGQRLSGVKNSFHNYRLIGDLMPSWTMIIEAANNDSYDEILLIMYKIIRTLLRGNHVNFFLLERTVPCYNNFMIALLKNMVVVSTWIEQYPELFEEYRNIMKLFAEHLMEVIFCSKEKQVVVFFNELLGINMQLTLKEIEEVKNGGKKSEDNLERSF